MAREASPKEPTGRAVGRRREARLVVMGVAGILLVWFALGNLRHVSIEFWVTQSRAPLIVVIAISGLLGASIATLARRRRPPDL